MATCTEEEYWKLNGKVEFYLENRHPDVTGYGATNTQRWEKIKQNLDYLDINLKEKTLIDLGCGFGLFLSYIKDEFKAVYGIEYDEKGAKIASELFPSIPIYQGDAFKITPEFDIYYTFNITREKANFLPLLNSLKKGQIFIESHDTSWNGTKLVRELADKRKFKVITQMDLTILIRK